MTIEKQRNQFLGLISIKNIVLGLLLLASISVHADTVGDKTIKMVHVHSSSGIYFETNEPFINPFSCTQDGIYRVSPGSQYEKEIFSILLSAKMANKKVTFHIPTGCPGGFVQVDWINTHD